MSDTPADRLAELIRAALHDGLDYFGTELDDVTGKVHAIEPQAKKYEAALVAFDSMVSELADLRAEHDRLTADAVLAEKNRRFEEVRANRAEAEIRSLTKGGTT